MFEPETSRHRRASVSVCNPTQSVRVGVSAYKRRARVPRDVREPVYRPGCFTQRIAPLSMLTSQRWCAETLLGESLSAEHREKADALCHEAWLSANGNGDRFLWSIGTGENPPAYALKRPIDTITSSRGRVDRYNRKSALRARASMHASCLDDLGSCGRADRQDPHEPIAIVLCRDRHLRRNPPCMCSGISTAPTSTSARQHPPT